MSKNTEEIKQQNSVTSAAVNTNNFGTVPAREQGSIYAFAKDTLTNPGVLFAAGQFFLFSSTVATLPVLGLATASIAMPLAAVNLGVSFGLSAYANRSKLPEPIKNKLKKVKDVVNTTLDKPAFRHTATFISNNTPDFIKNNIPKLDPNNPNTALTVNGVSISVLMAPLMLASGDLPRAGFALFIGLSNILKPLELEHKGFHADGFFKDGRFLSADTKKKLVAGEVARGAGMISLAIASGSTGMLMGAGAGEVFAIAALFLPEKYMNSFSEKIHDFASKFGFLKEKPNRNAIINSGFTVSSGISACIAFASGSYGAALGALGITGGNIRLIQLSQAKKAPPKPTGP